MIVKQQSQAIAIVPIIAQPYVCIMCMNVCILYMCVLCMHVVTVVYVCALRMPVCVCVCVVCVCVYLCVF